MAGYKYKKQNTHINKSNHLLCELAENGDLKKIDNGDISDNFGNKLYYVTD